MFGYMLFKNGDNPYKTPEEFQRRARQDIENHLKKFKYVDNSVITTSSSGTSNDEINNMMEVDSLQPQNYIEINNNNNINNNINNNNINNNNNKNKNTVPIVNKNKRSISSPLLRKLKQQKNKNYIVPETSNNKLTAASESNQYTPQLTYGSSPLRKTLADSTVDNLIDSSDECSSIDSGKSGCSLSRKSAQNLLQQQQESLNRMLTRTSTLETSLFSGEANSIYTANTNDTIITDSNNNNNILTLNQALPFDFTDYYSPDLDVEKFSNGRPVFTKRPLKNWELNDLRSLLIYPELKPEWNNKIPEIQSPYPNINFRIQIIPNYYSDKLISEYLAHSDIYKEAKFDFDFKLKTATYIVERARLRHKQILIESFEINPSNFDNSNLTNNIQFDCYFKFEWRNIIENYLLNLGIEYQCRSEFKLRISKLKKIFNDKNVNHNSSNLKNNLYKKVLIENKNTISEDEKKSIWKDVQSEIYRKLNMDGWDVTA
jgi:hypothetical protein